MSAGNHDQRRHPPPPPPQPQQPQPQQPAWRPEHGPGPVQALAQAYFRAHGRAQSEQLAAHQAPGLVAAQGAPRPGIIAGPRPPHAGHAASQSLSADELAHRLARLGTSTSGAHAHHHHFQQQQQQQQRPSPPSPLKPLPSLPPARTPSQHRHQQQNQSPYQPQRPAASTSLGIINERPPRPVQHSAHAAVAFPEPPHAGYRFPHAPQDGNIQASPASNHPAQPYPLLPRPPIQFPTPREHMRPPDSLSPPRLPPPPSRPLSAEARFQAPAAPLVRPVQGAERPPLPSRPYSDQPATRPGVSSPAQLPRPAVLASSPSATAAIDASTLRTPQKATSGCSSASSGTTTPSRTGGLRDALPPPLPGQCWGIKRDGMRCTRKVGGKNGKGKATTPTASPSRPRSAATKQAAQSADSSPAHNRVRSPGLQRQKTGATRSRPIVLSDSEDDSDEDEDQLGTRPRQHSGRDRGPDARAGSSADLLAPPSHHAGHARKHRRSRSAGNDPVPTDRRERSSGGATRPSRAHWLEAEPVSSSDEDGVEEPQVLEPAYCFQHISEINKSPGFYIHAHAGASTGAGGAAADTGASDAYVEFGEYLLAPDGQPLSAQTQASLRSVMSAPLTAADVGPSLGERRGSAELRPGSAAVMGRGRGYMYIYELRDFSTATDVCLKVGRTSNVFRRMGEWRGRCRRRGAGLVLVAFEPSPRDQAPNRPGQAPVQSAQGVIGGAAEICCEGIYGSHKWERLTHLELLDIGRRLDEGPCEDCGARHREIFLIPRHTRTRSAPGGASGGRTVEAEADAIEAVRQIVRKWESFVRRLVS